jgi:uncharacterized protein
MIARHILSEILESLTYFPVVSIIGPRQVGKTTLAKALDGIISKPTHYLDLESTQDAAKLIDAEQYLRQFTDRCVIIDEVQARPDLFPILRALIDQQREPARFILLGSASPYLMRENTETLAGRIAYHELTPFGLLEVQNISASWQTHWVRGGFPGAYLAPSDQLSRRWLLNFIDTFVTRDVKRIRTVVPEMKISQLLSMVAHLHSSPLNVSQLANALGVSQPTVGGYLELLEASFLIRRLSAYFENFGKRLIKAPKLYVRDSGLLHRLLGIDSKDQLVGHPQCGHSWEGYVIEEIIRIAQTDSQFYYYRTSQGAELDLLWITPHRKRVAFEIKYSNSPALSKGFYESCLDIKPDGKYVVVPESTPYLLKGDVQVISLGDLLQDELGKWL